MNNAELIAFITNQVQNALRDQRIEQINNPLPISLQFRIPSVDSKSVRDGVLMYDPQLQQPVISIGNAWVPIPLTGGGGGGGVDSVATLTGVITAVDLLAQLNVESGANVTDTANVTSAGALMDSEVTNLDDVKNFNPANYAAASHNHTLADITDSGALAALASVGTGQIDDDAVTLPKINAAGTADGTTFLRGDGQWATPAGGGGGTSVTFFQVSDDGTTGQLTTGSFVDLAGMWAAPSITNSDFSWNGATGILTVNTAGTIELDAHVTSWNNANNRHQLEIQLYKNGTTVLTGDSQYASRNNTQDEGSCSIHSFKDTAAVNDTYRIRVLDVGVAATVGASQIAGQTYFGAKLYS